tara:strand:- start:114 stop:377 length:264 start_codon:yes stop_codon:yes gene_type:complete
MSGDISVNNIVAPFNAALLVFQAGNIRFIDVIYDNIVIARNSLHQGRAGGKGSVTIKEFPRRCELTTPGDGVLLMDMMSAWWTSVEI